MDNGDRAVDSALDAERLATRDGSTPSASWDCLLAGGGRDAVRAHGTGWIGAPAGLFHRLDRGGGSALCGPATLGAGRRVGSLAIALVDMPMLLILTSRIIDALRAAGLAPEALQALGARSLVLRRPGRARIPLALDRRRLTIAAAIAAACEVRAHGAQRRSRDTGVDGHHDHGNRAYWAMLAYAERSVLGAGRAGRRRAAALRATPALLLAASRRPTRRSCRVSCGRRPRPAR